MAIIKGLNLLQYVPPATPGTDLDSDAGEIWHHVVFVRAAMNLATAQAETYQFG
ncbi:hypothetical protein KPSA1_07346 [Pseudomonas syringae pv. actinidiae]|uniref:Uncharacterized protein n=1 Tax=Pseudomonas syringae pv. actinidiae TaxID=103796 RepID=A0A2V0QX93_PSESF|nr:hypothetical protein KPSA1_07346 [Pseudomonas syringae pv. actinidiae]